MERPLVCLCLTEKTLAKDLALVERYRRYIDIAELRVDFLEDDERLSIRDFPTQAGLPCILTIRRKIDGGAFDEGEASRTMLFARALAFADEDSHKNFAYVDFEEDFHVPSLQDAAMAFGTKIIRSVHDMNAPVTDIVRRLAKMRSTGYEIPKIACMPRTLSDVTALFHEARELGGTEQILCAMGPLGMPSRILAARLHSYLTYTSPVETKQNLAALGQLDPVTLEETYHFRSVTADTKIYGITGWPLNATSSPALHNGAYVRQHIDAVFVPVRSQSIEEAMDFAGELDMGGLSVTVPYKEAVLADMSEVSAQVGEIGASNTAVRSKDGRWTGYNTDAVGFTTALKEFLGSDLSHRHVAIIGAGGAAKAVAYGVKELNGKACVFNRTVSRAKDLADRYGFMYAPLGPESDDILRKYSDVIIQTTSKGMGSCDDPNQENDPIYFYDFTGREKLFDIVYVPEVTPVMARAAKAGCKVCNGYSMLRYQGYKQFELFTGVPFEVEG